ncbi:MAG: GGDEF domain-containing protein [Vampirovibrionales bacterium]
MPQRTLSFLMSKITQAVHILALKDRQKLYPLLGLTCLSSLYEVMCMVVQNNHMGATTIGTDFTFQIEQMTLAIAVLYTLFIFMPPLRSWLKWTLYSFFPLSILAISGLMISQHHASLMWYSLPILMMLGHLPLVQSPYKWLWGISFGVAFINLAIFLPQPVHHINALILKQDLWINLGGALLKSLAFVYLIVCFKRYEEHIVNLNRALNVEKDTASKDALTGLMNRRSLTSVMLREISRSRRTGTPLSVAMLDIDHFKQINDVYGHKAGDDVLVELAKVLRQNLRDVDVVSRYGGEEFALILPETRCLEALSLLDRLRRLVQDHIFVASGKPLRMSISSGVTQFDPRRHDATTLFEEADLALYESKRGGRNQVRAYGLGKMNPVMLEATH